MPEVMKTVGRYEILRELGRGGMAKVYLARQTDLDRFVALKELGAFHQDDESFAQRFLRESRVAGSLSHPNVVTVHDYFQHDGTPYIAMEYVERGSLRPWVGRMNLAQIGGVLEGMLAGLTHAEQQEIVHRDLKPENVMITSDGRVKIADFGIAKARNKMQTGAFLTATGTTVGTPTYMAPEQAMAQEVGPWTDMYSIGVMAWEFFVGRVPFHDSDAPMAILLRHVNEAIPLANTVQPNVPGEIAEWIDRMLVKEAANRTRNAQTAWDDFEGIIIDRLGPRWRREARLTGSPTADQSVASPKPLTPAPFQAEDGPPVPDTGQAWGDAQGTPQPPITPAPPVTPAPQPAGYQPPPPGPATPPPGPGVRPGSDTLEEHFNQPSAPAAAPGDMAVEPTGMLTFGAPASPADAPPGHDTPAPPVTPAPGYGAPPVSPPPPGTQDPGAEFTQMPQRLVETPVPTAPAKPKAARSLVPFIVIGALLAAVVGFGISKAVGGGGDKKPPPADAVTPTKPGPTSSAVAFKTPPTWLPIASPASIPNLPLENAVAAGPPGQEATQVIAGTIKDPAIKTLLPAKFDLGGAVESRQAVDLVSAEAYKYVAVRLSGLPGELNVYAIPTKTGSTVLACVAPSIAAFSAQCESVALTLQLTGAEAAPLGPNETLAGDLKGILDGLTSKVKTQVAAITAAKKSDGQASTTKRVAETYHAAAKQVLALKGASFADEQLTKPLGQALRSVGKDYDKLSTAYKRKQKKTVEKVQAAIGASTKKVQDELAKFADAGYKVQG